MTTTYTGLCIGGPRDGLMQTCEKPTMVVPIRKAGWQIPDPPWTAEILAERLTRMEYKHVEGPAAGFWIPADRDAIWATEQLIDTYVAVHGC